MSDNQVSLTGGVVREIEIKFLDSGQAAGRFTLAVDNGYMKNGEWQKKVSYLDVTAYGKLAENAQETLKPGYRVCITGKAQQRSWETQDGGKRSVTEFIADDISISLKFVTVELHKAEPKNPANSRDFDDNDPF